MGKDHLVGIGVGVIASGVASIFGGWTQGLTVLCIFITFDFITGLIAATLNKSDKTESGGLSSKVIWLGIAKKLCELMFVAIGHQLDLLTGSTFIRDAVIISYVITETISIIENAGIIGLPIPPVLIKVIDVLKQKQDVDAGASGLDEDIDYDDDKIE